MEDDDGQARFSGERDARQGVSVAPASVTPAQVPPANASANPALAMDAGMASEEGMQNLLDRSEQEYRTLRRGEVVEGVVASVSRDGILIDIHAKSEGIIPGAEAQRLINDNALSVGDDVLVFVVQTEDEDGRAVLSLRRARSERGWRTAQQHFDNKDIFEAEVIEQNSGGLVVNADGVHGFIPMSQVASIRGDGSAEETSARLAALIGQKIPVKVLEIDRKRNRLILSERQAVQERRGQRKDQLLSELQEGETRKGRVSSITDFGVFVDLGGADGLIHLSELSWNQVNNPRELLNIGDEIDVYVLGVDREKKKIALSLRRLQPEPWQAVSEKYKVGDVVTGTVTRLATFGAFVRLEGGIEGLVHISELSEGHVAHPRNVVREGEVVRAKVLRVEPERRRLGLSLRQVEPDEEESA